MKLSFWNWIHLLVPYFIALYCYKNWEESFLGWLFLGFLLTEMITMVPYMDRDVKTGKSFKTKYGRIEEYQTVKGESANDMGNMTAKIHLAHFLGIILLIIYGIYSIISSMNVNKSNAYDKPEDTLAVSSPAYNRENYSDTNISEYNVEDSTNINISEKNEEIDTVASVSPKVVNMKHELKSNNTEINFENEITEKELMDINDKFIESEDKLSKVRDQLLSILTEKEKNIFWDKQRRWFIDNDEEAQKIIQKHKNNNLGHYYQLKYFIDRNNSRIKEILKIYNSKKLY